MRTSIIGGDSAHRGLFGGRISKPRLWALGSSVVLTLVLVFVIGLWALLVGVVLIGPRGSRRSTPRTTPSCSAG